MITGLAHVCFIVKDLEASIHFYRDQLGLRPGFDFVNGKGERMASTSTSGRALFSNSSPASPPGGKPSYQHICIEVDDINATVAQFRTANGVEAPIPPWESDQSWQAWLQGPGGESDRAARVYAGELQLER